MKPPAAQDLGPTPAEAAGLLRRISRRVVQWITLRDAFLYAWAQLGNSKIAQSELREKLEAGEIGARAQIFEVFDLTAGLLNSDWADDTTTEPHETFRREIIVPKFWARAEVDYSGRDFARSVGLPYVFKVHGISIRRDDVFRIWPLPEPPAESEAPKEPEIDATSEHQGQPLPEKATTRKGRQDSLNPAIPDARLDQLIVDIADGQKTLPEILNAIKAAAPNLDVPRGKFRAAVKRYKDAGGSKILDGGDTKRTLRSKSAG